LHRGGIADDGPQAGNPVEADCFAEFFEVAALAGEQHPLPSYLMIRTVSTQPVICTRSPSNADRQ
jgi:hypothetical protein